MSLMCLLNVERDMTKTFSSEMDTTKTGHFLTSGEKNQFLQILHVFTKLACIHFVLETSDPHRGREPQLEQFIILKHHSLLIELNK